MRYKTKSPAIEAFRFGYTLPIPQWWFDAQEAHVVALNYVHRPNLNHGTEPAEAVIHGPDKTVVASYGDWIIREPSGELRFCTHRFFEATYEPE